MKYILPILLCALCTKASAQSFLNGDFENNSASECQFNLANADYSSKMSNSWAFGTGEEVDIQTFVCGYETPPSNNWFVSISKDTEGNCDAISLELSENLIPGHEYEISYYSSALMGNAGLQFGLSSSKQEFGDLIFSSDPVLNVWIQKTHTFVAPNNGKYITVRTDSASPLGGWNLIDDFQMTPQLGVGENALNSIVVFPNPSAGQFTISTGTDISQIRIFNTVGQLVKTKETAGLTSISFELESNGVYFLTMNIGGQMVSKKIVVSNR